MSEIIPALPRRSSVVHPRPKHLRRYESSEVKVLLLENINATAVEAFRKHGYTVETYQKALAGDELVEKIRHAHIIGIRSKTKLTKEVLDEAKHLLAVGCFCIGTNQVNLQAAAQHGIAVFNSPFSNSRSVAELVIAEIIALMRQLGDRNHEMHTGMWSKISSHCHEIRGKVLGIVGYGHIGAQLSVLAEAMGMTVVFYDVVQIMPLGTARQLETLEELLSMSDVVSLHVPELEETKQMIGLRELQLMKKGAHLINNSRGSVVQLPALTQVLQSGHLAGAAVDVYPKEPAENGPGFTFYPELMKCKNVIMTPHIGGSTDEAQRMIGLEVSTALNKYINEGTSNGAVNLPEIDLRAIREEDTNTARLLYIHKNVPGVLRSINEILSNHNVEKQYSDSKGNVAYLMVDISNVSESERSNLYHNVVATAANIRTRILY